MLTYCDYLFTTDRFANKNLRAEGVAEEKIVFVGNVMIDTLMKHREMTAGLDVVGKLGLEPGKYATLTMHRPSDMDDRATLEGVLGALEKISGDLPIVFPIHSRARKMAEQFGLNHYFTNGEEVKGIWLIEPLGYLEFLHLNMHAKMVLTDSGGLQEETTVLGVPCITMRHNTERPVTCEVGTNMIVGNDPEKILSAARMVMSGEWRRGGNPEKWDGRAAERIVAWLVSKAETCPDRCGHVLESLGQA